MRPSRCSLSDSGTKSILPWYTIKLFAQVRKPMVRFSKFDVQGIACIQRLKVRESTRISNQ